MTVDPVVIQDVTAPLYAVCTICTTYYIPLCMLSSCRTAAVALSSCRTASTTALGAVYCIAEGVFRLGTLWGWLLWAASPAYPST